MGSPSFWTRPQCAIPAVEKFTTENTRYRTTRVNGIWVLDFYYGEQNNRNLYVVVGKQDGLPVTEWAVYRGSALSGEFKHCVAVTRNMENVQIPIYVFLEMERQMRALSQGVIPWAEKQSEEAPGEGDDEPVPGLSLADPGLPAGMHIGGILQQATTIINGAWQSEYGTPQESFGRIAAMWSAYLGREVTAKNVADMMILLKVSRAANGHQEDSYVDIAGYAALTEVL